MDKLDILKEYFGYDKLKKEQESIIDNVMDNKDIIGLLPTGYGKSITFQIPALLLEGITIVVSPLIALMQDQVKNLKEKYINAEYINSLQTKEEKENIYNKIKKGKVKILYVAAERLEVKSFLDVILKCEVSLIVIDEAHTLLWSEDFRMSLGHIPSFINRFNKKPKIMALTATATNNTINKIIKLLDLNNPKLIIGMCDRENIFYSIINTNKKNLDLIKYINKYKDKRGIIYCLTINHVMHVYEYLNSLNYKVTYYHGGLDSKLKKNNQNDFTNSNKNIMVATNAFGMGIDIPDIRYVIMYDLPSSIEDFSQQSGRASRDGAFAEAILFFNLKDIDTIKYFIDNIDNKEKSSSEIKKIKKEMVNLCISHKCIHKEIVNYFGLEYKKKCNMCSNCKKMP